MYATNRHVLAEIYKFGSKNRLLGAAGSIFWSPSVAKFKQALRKIRFERSERWSSILPLFFAWLLGAASNGAMFCTGTSTSTTTTSSSISGPTTTPQQQTTTAGAGDNLSATVRFFLTGDVMLGRGVDQILEHHVNPVLYEGYVKDARQYVELAVHINGPLPEHRPLEYVWGDALEIFKQMKPDVRMINLETSVTERGEPWPGKGIHYRMHPKNVPVISAAGIHCCVLSNNHVLDWGYTGLKDTLRSLTSANIKVVGAGLNQTEAQQPAVFNLPHKSCRVLIFGAGSPSAGVYGAWQATDKKPGVFTVDESFKQDDDVQKIAELIKKYRRPRYDLVVFALHWGGNWGYDLEPGQQQFARKLIDEAGVDLVYGHSSHHIKGVEVYKGKLILYGCGDLLTDYEGIKNEDTKEFRDDLSFMYFVDLYAHNGGLAGLQLVPMRLKHMQLRRAQGQDEQWLFDVMRRECRRLGATQLERSPARDHFKLLF